jgi:hypothetical protein
MDGRAPGQAGLPPIRLSAVTRGRRTPAARQRVVVGLLCFGLLAAGCTTGGGSGGAPFPVSAVPCRSPTGKFVTSISSNGRYFLDQHRDPLLVRGDSPWSGITRWSSEQAERYFADREAHGFNASIMSLVGAVDNGGPSADGASYDGIAPFVGGDVTKWNEAYWRRVDAILRSACAHGNTVFLYPMDGWNFDPVFRSANVQAARNYGATVAKRYANFPNIVWMAGGDYFARDRYANQMFAGMLDGIRSTGDRRPFSIQLWYQKSLSTDSPDWRDRVDWNFVYTYLPTYRAVLDGYGVSQGGRRYPSLLGEANYEGENNQPATKPTTNETLRRQALWALTSGSPGNFFGSADWQFLPGWEGRLDTRAVTQLQTIHDFFAARNWWTLQPDTGNGLVTAGRGTEVTDDTEMDVLDNDYATAARSADGRWSVVYVPTARTLTLDTRELHSSWSARWIDPADATGLQIRAVVDSAGHVTTPGINSDGGADWLLLIES